MKIRLKDGCEISFKYISVDIDRHGNVRVYFRRHGHRVRLRDLSSVENFKAEYLAALEGRTKSLKKLKPQIAARGSLRWLIEKYYGSPEFKGLKESTRTVRRNILDKISEKYGANPYELLEPKHVRTLIRDPKADFPEAANGYVKALRQVFKWAVEVGHADKNPAKEVPLLKSNNPDGWHTWTEEEIHKFEYRHPIGSKARLALALGLYTGARKSDAIRLGRQMERNGFLCFTEQKGETIKRKDREVPILEQLRKVIDATPSDHLTYLVTEFGKPYSSGGFGNWFRRRCNEAGLPHCSFHGLRKAGATIAANNGATGHQLMAMFGWDSLKQAARYTEKANRNKLAGDAMHLLVPGHTENKSVSPNTVINSGETNKEKKA